MLRASLVALTAFVASAERPLWRHEFTLTDLKDIKLVDMFESWITDTGRTYVSEEEKWDRFVQWTENLVESAKHNSEDHTWKMALNQFADLDADEFAEYVRKSSQGRNPRNRLATLGVEKVAWDGGVESVGASSVDWTQKGVVTPVKDQGQCGSCWTFSATGAMECGYAINGGGLTSLSEQEIVDCDRSGSGCNGGWESQAMEWAAKQGGLCTEDNYPYTAKDGTCKSSSCGSKHSAPNSVSDVTTYSTSALESAINKQCVTVAVDGAAYSWQMYSSGVLTSRCGDNLDHAVLAVGYGTDGSNDYWKVKNSWGTSWGEDGYIRLCRNCNANNGAGQCGILADPAVPNY